MVGGERERYLLKCTIRENRRLPKSKPIFSSKHRKKSIYSPKDWNPKPCPETLLHLCQIYSRLHLEFLLPFKIPSFGEPQVAIAWASTQLSFVLYHHWGLRILSGVCTRPCCQLPVATVPSRARDLEPATWPYGVHIPGVWLSAQDLALAGARSERANSVGDEGCMFLPFLGLIPWSKLPCFWGSIQHPQPIPSFPRLDWQVSISPYNPVHLYGTHAAVTCGFPFKSGAKMGY